MYSITFFFNYIFSISWS